MSDDRMERPTHSGVIPHLCVDDAAAALDFYARAFGATEMMRLAGPGGKIMHAAMMVNGAPIFLNDEFPDMGGLGPTRIGGTAVTMHLQVDDADAAAARAVAAGATVVMPVEDQFWGDRYGLLRDPFGHQWAVAHSVRQVSPDELGQIAAQMQGG